MCYNKIMETKKEIVHKGFKYRLYPTQEQEEKLAVQFGHARFVYNSLLAERKRHYKEAGKGLSCNATAGLLKDIKRTPGFEWLKEGDPQMLQQSLMNLQNAYECFFRKQKVSRNTNPKKLNSLSATHRGSSSTVNAPTFPKWAG